MLSYSKLQEQLRQEGWSDTAIAMVNRSAAVVDLANQVKNQISGILAEPPKYRWNGEIKLPE